MGKYRYNRYHDVEIDVSFLPHESADLLDKAIAAEETDWERRFSNRRGIETAVMWLRIPTKYLHVLPTVLGQKDDCPKRLKERPFKVHHATENHTMVVRGWRKDGRPNIPLYGTHYVRVECLVVEDETGRILMVTERVGAEGRPKLVTGSVNPGERISEAAIREVKEETGILPRFVKMLGIGNRLQTRFDKDEVLVGVLLSAASGQKPTTDGVEIQSAAWFRPEEVINRGSLLAKEWMVAAAASSPMSFGTLPDFRGPPHVIEFHTSKSEARLF